LLLVYYLVAVQYTPTNGGSFPDAAVMPAFLVSWLGGTAHVLALQSGFTSADDLLVYCDGMTPDRLNIIRERLAFVPM
jgi:hypothetical protein